MPVQPPDSNVRELFVKAGTGNPTFGSFEYEQKESKGNYDIKKKRRAPPPPTGLGGYKPKILGEDPGFGNVPINRDRPDEGSSSGAPSGANRSSVLDARSSNGAPARALIIGDHNTPMVLHPYEDDVRNMEAEVHGLVLRSDVVAVHEGGTETENPLFGMRQCSTEEHADGAMFQVFGMRRNSADEYAEQPVHSNGTDDTTENPLFGMRQNSTEDTPEDEEPNGVFIPDPDYDEEEKTIVLAEEPEEDAAVSPRHSPRRGQKVYKEYAGEDFSQYLSDDEADSGIDHLRRQRRPMHIMERKSKTEAKRPHYKKRESLPPKLADNRNSKGFGGSASLRDFTYADSKFATLRGGSDKKRNSLGSIPQDGEAELFVNTGSSYETFLRTKNGEVMDNFSTDSGFETDRGGHPGELPARYSHSRDSVWKRMTWKLKKHVHVFDLGSK